MSESQPIIELWETHGERIRRAALMLTGNLWDADDLVQETFATISDSHQRFQGRSAVYTWLYGILLNHDRRRRRRLGTHARKVEDLKNQLAQSPPSFPAADVRVVQKEWE